jgi:seryl-tRNA synthetase
VIDINILRNNPDAVRASVAARGADVDVDALLQVDADLRAAMAKRDELRAERNRLAGPEHRDRMKQLKSEIAEAEGVIPELETRRDTLWALLPNLMPEDTPRGTSDADNLELRRWGTQPQFSFEPKTHEVLGAELDILDMERGARVAASGFYYWKGDGARLATAIFSAALQYLHERGFVQMMTPVLAQTRTLFGTGYLPFFSDQIYKLENEDLSLIGTSEQTLLGYHIDDIINVDQLPLQYTSFTPCFRTESGSYGRKGRGAFRVHQFHKVEQIVACRPEDSDEWLHKCLDNIEQFMQLLEIPYRVVRVCVGDLGAPAYKKYDVEGWFAGFAEFRETHSNTNLIDYQSRRLAFRARDGKQMLFPHTISATMITDRAALAVIENNQQADGSIVIPEYLRKWMGGQERITKK